VKYAKPEDTCQHCQGEGLVTMINGDRSGWPEREIEECHVCGGSGVKTEEIRNRY
jgi:DnaJ-class molecular chaperone